MALSKPPVTLNNGLLFVNYNSEPSSTGRRRKKKANALAETKISDDNGPQSKSTSGNRETTEQEIPFHGRLLFVNHDAKHMDTLPNRQRVFSHVQGNYRKWKRHEDNKALLASVKRPVILRGEGGEDKPDEAGQRTEEEDGQLQKLHSTRHRAATPLSILQKGDSDPFNTLGIKITPEVNSMIAFYRDDVLFALFHKQSRDRLTSSAAQACWQQLVDGLADPGCSYGLLACAASLAARSANNPAMRTYATASRQKSILLLRSRLSDPGDAYNPGLLWHLNTACVAEIYDHNLAGAQAHSKWVRHVFEKLVAAGPLSVEMITRLLEFQYNDVQLSTMFLSRPVFDVHVWVPNAVALVLDLAAQLLPPFVMEVSQYIHPSVEHEKMREVFSVLRRGMAIWYMDRDQDVAFPELAFVYANTHACLALGKFIDHYLDFKEADLSTASDHDAIFAEQYTALAALYWTWALGLDVTLNGIPIFDSSRLTLIRLRRLLIVSERPVDDPSWVKYKELRLWAYFVGALSEQRERLRRPAHSSTWFNQQLARHTRAMGLSSWDEVESVLEGFLYSKELSPAGDQWFEDTMNAWIARQVP